MDEIHHMSVKLSNRVTFYFLIILHLNTNTERQVPTCPDLSFTHFYRFSGQWNCRAEKPELNLNICTLGIPNRGRLSLRENTVTNTKWFIDQQIPPVIFTAVTLKQGNHFRLCVICLRWNFSVCSFTCNDKGFGNSSEICCLALQFHR